MADVLKFEDYDVFGFDIDNTLAKYNIPNLFELVNDSVTDFLIQHGTWKKGSPTTFNQDFCCRGIVFERKRGNFLKLSEDGYILRASHGTRYLKDEEIEEIYGKERHWPYFDEIIKNVNNVGDNRIFENFFDMPLVNAMALLVDQSDEQGDKRDAWETLFPAAQDTYAQVHFKRGASGLLGSLVSGRRRYVRAVAIQSRARRVFPQVEAEHRQVHGEMTPAVRAWMKRLRAAGKKLFLMSSSYVDYATTSMRHILGDDWQDYFDITITNAKKPGFFYKDKPFLATEKCDREAEPVEELKEGGIYSQGNLKTFNAFLAKLTGKKDPKVIYFGDSLRSDVFPGKSYAGWESVLILEEMVAEQWQGNQLLHKAVTAGTSKDGDGEDKAEEGDKQSKKQKIWGPSQLEKEYLTSEHWGSFFTDDRTPNQNPRRPLMNTLWGYMIRKYADLAIPQLEYITEFPFDHEFIVFNHEESHQWGFYPEIPLALRPNNDSDKNAAIPSDEKSDKKADKK